MPGIENTSILGESYQTLTVWRLKGRKLDDPSTPFKATTQESRVKKVYPFLLEYYAGPRTIEIQMGPGWTWSNRTEEETGARFPDNPVNSTVVTCLLISTPLPQGLPARSLLWRCRERFSP